MHSMIGLAAVFIAIAAVAEPAGVRYRRGGRADSDRQPVRALHRLVRGRDHVFRQRDRVRQTGGPLQVPPFPGGTRRVQGPASAERGAGPVDDHRGPAVCGFAILDAVHRDAGHCVRARCADHHPDRWCRHAGRGLDAEQLLGLGGGRDRVFAEQSDADHRGKPGRLQWRDPVPTSCAGDEPLVLQRHPGRVRGRSGCRRRGRRRATQREVRRGGGRRFPAGQRRVGDHRSGLRIGGGARANTR